MRTYTPRRQSARWLDGDCPRGVLAIYDNGPTNAFDRFDVFYAETDTDHHGDVWVSYLASSEGGSYHHGELRAHEAAEYRARVSRRACRWTDLPEAVRDVVRRDLAPDLTDVDPATRDPYAYPEGFDAVTDAHGN